MLFFHWRLRIPNDVNKEDMTYLGNESFIGLFLLVCHGEPGDGRSRKETESSYRRRVGSHPQLLGFPDDAARVLVLTQADELGMPQPVCIRPFKEFDLSDRFRP